MLQSAFPLVPTAILVGFGLVCLALVERGLADLSVAYRLSRTPPARVADVPNERGPLSVTGAAGVEEGTVATPFSGTECLVREWTVEEESATSTGPNGRRSTAVSRRSRSASTTARRASSWTRRARTSGWPTN